MQDAIHDPPWPILCQRAHPWGTPPAPQGQRQRQPNLRNIAEAVTQSVAGAMLGVTRGTIVQMLARGGAHQLERHPDGGIVMASVLREIDRRGLER
jgi:hypothetical protein